MSGYAQSRHSLQSSSSIDSPMTQSGAYAIDMSGRHHIGRQVKTVALVWCYKVVFGLVDININDFFSFNNSVVIRGHQYKLYKKRTVSHIRATFFSERVINVWNSLHKDVDFSSLLRFKHSIKCIDFSSFIKCF